MQYKLHASLLVSTVALTLFSTSAFATNGYASHGFGMVQKSMGGTAVAGSDNTMNGATNPASLGNSTDGIIFGVDIFSPERSMTHGGRRDIDGPGPDTGIAGARIDGGEDSVFPVPEIAYQKRINAQHTLGIVVYGNGGMNSSYDRPIFGPPTGPNSGINLEQLFIAPSWAMNIGANHTIGASINLVYQTFEAEGIAGFSPFSRDASKMSDNGKDSATGAGISLGWQGKLTPALTAGATYRSESEMSEFDDYAGLFAEQGDFNVPSMITAGVSFQASPAVTVALDLARINYTDVAAISNKNNTAALQGQLLQGTLPASLTGPKLGDDDGAGFGWEDQNIIKLGVKYKYNDTLTFMAGFNHGDAPIPETETAFNVLAPATVEDHLTLGLNWTLANKSILTVAYMHAFENEIKGESSFVDVGLPTERPANPGAFIPIGMNPSTDAAAADINMVQNSIGVSYSINF